MQPVGPAPGLEALLHGLSQGPQPQGNLANLSMTDLLMGLGGQASSMGAMSPALQQQLSPFLRNAAGGQTSGGN